MNTLEYVRYTNSLLSELSSAYSPSFNLSADIVNDIKNVTNRTQQGVGTRVKEVEFKSKAGSDFGIPKAASSMPYITGIHDDNKITLKTIEPATFKMTSNSRLSNELKGIHLHNFRNEIKNINKAAFSRGLDLDNFHVLNVSNAPLNRDALKYLTDNGALLPIGSNHGVFIPEFALNNATYNSLEYEGRFVERARATSRTGLNMNSFQSMVTDVVKQDFGINVEHLLTHAAGNSPSIKAYDDFSIANMPGAQRKEVVFGAAPLSNLIMATHLAFASWDKRGAIMDRDRIMDKSSGMHISNTISSLGASGSADAASNYLNHAGILIGSLSRNAERWGSSSYLGVSNQYSSDRADFRIDSNTQRLESRYPGTVFDIAHVTDQLIMANKISSDVENYISYGQTQRNRTNVVSGFVTPLSGNKERSTGILKALHDTNNPRHRDINRWFDSFMEHIGINNDVSKKFVKSMNAKCLNT